MSEQSSKSINSQSVNNHSPTPQKVTNYFDKIKVTPNGMFARIILAFLTTAGIFYINIMPAVVNGLKEGLAFTSQQVWFC
ncbi:hypothetical protein L3081_11910 [Colwellia sp. MSW7]|uniref:Uncharacterized protein n=1 Tax=Colwellia maritima TaxID=2912588 RepID=A0ABS9X1N7_9GAMM|nr:hypothetical protein [Colwellia maritima]MCI2283980.1 hypothetical protein [Colwellia maritima]